MSTVRSGIQHTPEQTAALTERLRAAGKLPPRGAARAMAGNAKNAQPEQRVVMEVDCEHRGELRHEEPCKCGAASKIPVFECLAEGNKRASGASGMCVKTSHEHKRIKDKDARQTLLICETCELRKACEKID